MPNQILHKRSSTPGAAPEAGQLADGELALNLADGKIFAKKADGTVVPFPAQVDGGVETTNVTTATYYFKNRVDDNWGNAANWFLDPGSTYPAFALPPDYADVVITSPCDLGSYYAQRGYSPILVNDVRLCGDSLDEFGNVIPAALRDYFNTGAQLNIYGNLIAGDETVAQGGYSPLCAGGIESSEIYLQGPTSTATFYFNGYYSSYGNIYGGTVIFEGGYASAGSFFSLVEMRWGDVSYVSFYGGVNFYGGTMSYSSFYAGYGSTPAVINIDAAVYSGNIYNSYMRGNYFYAGDVHIYELPSIDYSVNYFNAQSWGGGLLNIEIHNSVDVSPSWFDIYLFDSPGSGIVFRDSSTNSSVIYGPATFEDTASNTISGNIDAINDSATFNGASTNYGLIMYNATFNGTARNYGTVYGEATFNDSACNDSAGSVNTSVPNPPPSC